jgi:hypothetical protein
MRNLVLILFFSSGIISCKDKMGGSSSDLDSNSQQKTLVAPTFTAEELLQDSATLYASQYLVQNEDAWDMIRQFRTPGVHFRDQIHPGNPPYDRDDKKNLRVEWDPVLLKLAAKYGMSILAVTAAYLPSSGKPNKPTILLRVYFPPGTLRKFSGDTAYIRPQIESICPEPTPCP